MSVLCYTYDADHHCVDCARHAFSSNLPNGIEPDEALDGEGNPVSVVFSHDEWHEPSLIARQVLACGTCGELIDEYLPLDEIVTAAGLEGSEAGRAAASWFFSGTTSDDEYRRVIAGIDDGDPEVLDRFPSAPFSGEWADGLNAQAFLDQYGLPCDHPAADDVLSSFEENYAEAAADAIEAEARRNAPEPDIWSLLESPPAGCAATADLWHWSTNYDPGKGPASLFLDLIGWSQDELGQPVYDLSTASLGYLELGKLAAALDEYSDRPSDVREYVDALLAAESR